MTGRLHLLLALPALAAAQLQIYVAPPNTETPVAGLYDVGTISVGDSLSTRFRLRNNSNVAVTLQTLHVAGRAFAMSGQPSLPYTVAPGLNVDFTIRFQPPDYGSYSANIAFNGSGLLLRGSGTAAAVVRAAGEPIAAGASLDFGRVERGAAAARLFELSNPSTTPVSVGAVEVSGAAFRLLDVPSLPLTLAPGASASFQAVFEPRTAGVFTGSLTIDSRSYRLTGAAQEPPFERPAVTFETSTPGSARQVKVGVRFPAPSRANGAGRLRLAVQPAPPATAADAAILFPATGTRTVEFTVSEGDTAARFSSTSVETLLQTGTTAGTIVVTAEVGGFTEQASITVAPAAVKIDSSRAVRNGSMIELHLTGYDNTHALSGLAFTFYDPSGQPLQPAPLRIDASADFRRYFDASTLGGAFSLKAVFPVAGDAARVAAVEAELVNPAGTVRTERVRF